MVTQHLERLVRQIFREVITLLRCVRLLNEMVVFHQVGIPVVGFTTKESVEAVEALLQWPLGPAGAACYVFRWNVVVLSQPERAEAIILKHLANGAALRREPSRGSGKSICALGNGGAAIHMMVAAGEKRGTCRGTERSSVPLRVPESAIRQPLQRRHIDAAAKWRPCGQASIVVEHDQDVGCSSGRSLERIWCPVGFGIANVEFDDAFE